MPINPKQLQKLPSIGTARTIARGINQEAVKDSGQMDLAGQKLQDIHTALINRPFEAKHDNYFDAEDHLTSAISAHNSGDYRNAISHVLQAHDKVKLGGYQDSRTERRSPALTQSLKDIHGAFDAYYAAATPARVTTNRHTGSVSVVVNPDYVAKGNPAYARERQYNATKLKNRNALKETK
jgi:hypothetical protein